MSRIRDLFNFRRKSTKPENSPASRVCQVVQQNLEVIRQELLDHCKLLNHRDALLTLLPKNLIVAELGVLAGDWSELMLTYLEPKQLHLIDLYNCSDSWREPPRFTAATHLDFVKKRFQHRDNIFFRKGDTIAVLQTYPDHYFDILYLDSDHFYDHVMGELTLGAKKLKDGGYLILNDYTIYDYIFQMSYGVIPAVNEFMNRYDYSMEYFAITPHLYCDVVLRKRSHIGR